MTEFDPLGGASDFSEYLLEQAPSWLYFSSAPFTQEGYSPAQQRYWQGQYGNVSNQYAGALGQAQRQDMEGPSFMDFLTDLPFTEQYYQNVSPRQRGGFGRFSPATRFMF